MIRIRSCSGMDEMQACVDLQIETWGLRRERRNPRKTFLLAQKIGGQVIGAFDRDSQAMRRWPRRNPCRFAMSCLAEINSTRASALHSLHMLAVRPSHRNRGLGMQLKWEQRREALSRGIRHEWTFDPLEIKNAFLNIHRLALFSREYA